MQLIWVLCVGLHCAVAKLTSSPASIIDVPAIADIFEVPKLVRSPHEVTCKFERRNETYNTCGSVEVRVDAAYDSGADMSVLDVAVNPSTALSFLAFVMTGAIAMRWQSIRTGTPIKQTGGAAGRCLRWCHTTLCIYAQLFQFMMTLRRGWQGIVLAMLYQFTACVVLDCIISDALWQNYRSLRRNSYQNWQVAMSLCLSQVVWASNAFWAWYFVPEFEVSLSRPAAFSLVLSLIGAEIVFTSVHILMHQYEFCGRFIHKFHHCCLTPSMSSNYLFSPLDGLLEAYGPWLVAWSVYKFVVKDPWGLWLSLYVLQQWYLLDHDENVQTAHWFHHKFIDSDYSAYSSTKHRGVKDQLRHRVKRSDASCL